MTSVRAAPEYCADDRLAYERSRFHLTLGQSLTFDESYRLAHLPLVAPGHAAALRALPSRDYQDGRYATARHSLIAPVDATSLGAMPGFRALEQDLRARAFAAKVAWPLIERRASKLHVTIAGGLRAADLPACAAAVAPIVTRHAPFRYRLGGPFLGAKNRGRLYFTTYPECVDGDDLFGTLQDAAGVRRTQLYLLGYYNLRDELSVDEAAELRDFMLTWERRSIAELTCPKLALLATHDDLALDSRVIQRIGAPDAAGAEPG